MEVEDVEDVVREVSDRGRMKTKKTGEKGKKTIAVKYKNQQKGC